MSASSTPSIPFDTLVSRLRTAGCVFAEDEARLLLDAAANRTELARLLDRRVSGFPLEQVLGWAEFHGRRISVAPGVFVPRRRTEFLVRQALALGREASTAPVVVDLCCGTGALGAALAAALPLRELHASDSDPAAVRCARDNLAAAGGRVYEGDLYAALPDRLRGRVDILAANVPYVPSEEVALLPPEARDHEPRTALDGGTDGLDVLRRVAAEAPDWLAPGGALLVETGERQAATAVCLLAESGLLPRVRVDEEWEASVVLGLRPDGTGRPGSDERPD
ncbi:putative protein N(5)-glutamine methyltransferase [Streptomyces oceani]|uniref:peptide chain release factor N(5)-glutamine methyltransferase n=1 Tax=Streptomyces oceani TaxID=1075402 RepID=A0A1E7KFM5_9ACTN|nr:putative protein N(5)-glutamine methyltransferase [Streptomyces oceani]OEV02737.1 SAM-dependent methyltransferase [Streptomyces oceani]